MNQISLLKGIFSMIPTLIFIQKDKKSLSFVQYLKTDEIKIHVIRGVSGVIMVYLFLFALKSSSTSQANLLSNTTPIFVPLVAYLWKKIPINHYLWPGLALSFVGLFFLLHPEMEWKNISSFSALLSGVIGAIVIFAVRISNDTEPVLRTIFYYNLISILFSGILTLIENHPISPLHFMEFLPLLAIGLLGFFCQFFFTFSVKLSCPKFIAPFSYIDVIFCLLFDLIIWNTKILPLEWLGMGLILSGLILVSRISYKKSPELKKT